MKTNCNEIAFAGLSQASRIFHFIVKSFFRLVFFYRSTCWFWRAWETFICYNNIELRVLLFSFAPASAFHSPRVHSICSTLFNLSSIKWGKLENCAIPSIASTEIIHWCFRCSKELILQRQQQTSSDFNEKLIDLDLNQRRKNELTFEGIWSQVFYRELLIISQNQHVCCIHSFEINRKRAIFKSLKL